MGTGRHGRGGDRPVPRGAWAKNKGDVIRGICHVCGRNIKSHQVHISQTRTFHCLQGSPQRTMPQGLEEAHPDPCHSHPCLPSRPALLRSPSCSSSALQPSRPLHLPSSHRALGLRPSPPMASLHVTQPAPAPPHTHTHPSTHILHRHTQLTHTPPHTHTHPSTHTHHTLHRHHSHTSPPHHTHIHSSIHSPHTHTTHRIDTHHTTHTISIIYIPVSTHHTHTPHTHTPPTIYLYPSIYLSHIHIPPPPCHSHISTHMCTHHLFTHTSHNTHTHTHTHTHTQGSVSSWSTDPRAEGGCGVREAVPRPPLLPAALCNSHHCHCHLTLSSFPGPCVGQTCFVPNHRIPGIC